MGAPVARLDGDPDCLADLARLALPGAVARDAGAKWRPGEVGKEESLVSGEAA